MQPPGKAPKPKWKEMVAPYDHAPGPATLRDHLKHFPGWIWVQRDRKMWAVPLAPYIQRYGLDMTLIGLKRLRGWESISVATFGRNDEYRFPPIDQVPDGMKGYALIDPTCLPAPLRGRSREARRGSLE